MVLGLAGGWEVLNCFLHFSVVEIFCLATVNPKFAKPRIHKPKIDGLQTQIAGFVRLDFAARIPKFHHMTCRDVNFTTADHTRKGFNRYEHP